MSARGWNRWIALLLLAYPLRFRRRHGAELAAQYPPPSGRRISASLAVARDLLAGGLGARFDDARRAWTDGGGLDAWRADAAQALRGLTRRPAFATLIITTLALAAGLNAAVFAILDTTLLRPLPYPREESLATIALRWNNFPLGAVSLPEYVDFTQKARAFSSLAVYSNSSLNVTTTDGLAERIQAVRVSGSFFDVLGVPPALGRPFTADEDRADAPLAVITHRFWIRRFGGDPAVVGRELKTDDGVRQIVGVLPKAFAYPSDQADVYIPMNLVPDSPGSRGAHNRQVVGRLADDVTLAQAEDDMRRVAAEMAREHPAVYPADSGFGIRVIGLRERLVGQWRDALSVLMAAVLFVFLIACANVANLLVARMAQRTRETATQVAFGAPRGRLVRQALMEGLVAGGAGGAAGLCLAAALLAAFRASLPQDLPRPDLVLTDVRVLLFALLMTAAAGAATAGLAALRSTRIAVVEVLRAARSTADTHRTRAVLTTAQVALAVMLLVCGGFAARSFVRLIETDPGVRTDHVVTARVALSAARYPNGPARNAFFARVQQAIASQPGVVDAGAVSMLPLTGQTNDWTFGIEGRTPPPGSLEPTEQARVVHGDYFTVLGIELKEGRLFTDGDTPDAPRVVVVSELVARKYWAGESPVGRRIRRFGAAGNEPWATIVGVVADIRHRSLDEPPVPFLYFPLAQLPQSGMTLVARLDPTLPASNVIAHAVSSVDPEQPMWSALAMDEWLARSVAQPRFSLVLLAVFAALAVLLAFVGVYGVMSFAVTRRRREMGIRLALGARPRSLLLFVMRDAASLSGIGIVCGTLAALAAGRLLETLFPAVRLADPAVLTAVPLFVLAVALLASYIPARRAMRIDPMEALRAE